MAIARTGVYVDDYLEYSSTLAGDLQRILSTMRELDDRAHGIMGQTKEQIKYLLGVSSHGYDRSNVDDDESERMKKDIEASQDNALSLCTEKVLLARQAYDLIESHIKRLDEDLGQFAEDLKHEGKLPPDEPPVLPPVPVVSRDEKRWLGFSTPQSSKKFREREWDRERGVDFDLMPPPGSSKKAGTSMDVDQMIDPNEPTYCICHQVSYGDMIAYDNENCNCGADRERSGGMMSIFFTSRIRVLVVDDDAQFLKSSSTVLSALNYKVTTCGSPISALQVLTRNKLDAVLTNAFSAVACGFDFRASVESNLGIPVLYFLPLPREGSGEEADQLLRRLPPATYAIREPPYEHDMRPLRWVFAWRKCCLDAKVKQAARIPTAIVGDLMAGSTTDEEREDEEEERVQFKVVRASGRGRKRKASSNPGSSSGASLTGDHPGQRQQQMNAIEGQERDNMASNQQQERRGTRAKKNKGKAPQFQEPQAMDGRQLGQQQQQQQMSLLLQSLLHSLDVPPYNPGMFADAAGPSNNVATCAGASNAAAPPPALPPPRPVYPAPAPAPRPVYPAPAPMPPLPPVNPIPAPVPPVYPVPAPALPFAHQSLQPPMAQQGMFVPWRYGNGNGNGNGSIMLSFQGPPAGDLFTGVGTFGASAAATNLLGGDDHGELSAMATMYPGLFNPPLAPQHVGAASDEAAIAALYSNNYCARSLMAPQHIGHGAAAAANEEEEDIEALIIDGYINYNTAQFMAPQQVEFDHGVAPGEAAAMEEALNSISFSSGSSSLAPDQILGMASNVNEQAIAGGAFSDNAAASFVEPQNLVVAAPNGNNQLAPGALGDDDLNGDGSLMGSQGLGLHGAAVDGDDAGFSAMFPADQYEANTMFSLEDLLGLDDSPMSEAGQELNGQQGGATGGAAAAAAATGAAGTSPAGGEGGKATWDIEDDGDSDILDDLLLGDLWDNYRTSSDENNGHK